MGLGFTTSGRLDEHNRDDNTRSRESIRAGGDAKPNFYAMTLSPWHFHPYSFRIKSAVLADAKCCYQLYGI